MALNKKKQDEKNLKTLREMVALPHNKTCFDCHQRGPTYVNMATGSFVCTSCSGLLRGLNPPHRVKSISMTSFTQEEMEFLRQRGNDLCRRVWLGLYDNRNYAEPDSKDENKVKDFMCQKYEKKRWYVAPTEAMYEEAKRQNTPPAAPSKTDRPLKSLVGNNMPSLVVGNKQSPQLRAPAAASPASVAAAPAPSQPAASQSTPQHQQQQQQQPQQQPQQQQQQPKPQQKSGFDLLGDLGGDPFAQPTSTQTAAPGGGFADFSAFSQSSQPTAAAAAPSFPPSQTAPAFPPPSNAGFPPASSSGFPAASAGGLVQPMNAATSGGAVFSATTTTASMSTASDRYAALANLDNVLGTSSDQATVSWNGSGMPSMGAPPPSGPINWGGGGTLATSTATSMMGSGVPFESAPSKSNPNSFGAGGSAANPFSQQPAAHNQPAPQSVSNPFMAPSTAAGVGGGFPTNAAGFGGMPAATSAGFGGMPAATSAAFGGMPASTMAGNFSGMQYGGMQNGNFGAGIQPAQMQQPQAPAGPGQWGQPGVMNQPNMQMNAFGAGQQQAANFGKAVPQNQFNSWGVPQQPAATPNPFMGVASQGAVPPRGHSSNPFL